MDSSVPKDLLVPAWIFDHLGEYFMIGIEPDGRVRVDGGHSKPQGVAKAQRLHEAIAVIQPLAGTKFVMVKVEKIPAFKGGVNEAAINTLNQAAPKP